MNRRVLFDLQVFVEQRHGGVSRYFRELGRALNGRQHWEVVLPPGVHFGSADSAVSHIGPLIQLPGRPRAVRALRSVNLAAASSIGGRIRRSVDVIHPTWYHRPSLEQWLGVKPLVITIHDMIPETWPAVTTAEQVADRAWAIHQSAWILCVSETTRRDLISRFPSVEGRTSTAYPGMTSLPSSARTTPFEPQFVYVGKRGAYKDFATLVRALRRFRAQLTVVGGGPPSDSLLRHLDESGTSSLVTFQEAPDDQTLARLLREATALISTSRQEGFGIPPLEALSLGTPVILSDIPVHREVYGDWGIFFEPGNEESLADAMKSVADSPPRVPKRSDLAQRFSWEATAIAAEEGYSRAAG